MVYAFTKILEMTFDEAVFSIQRALLYEGFRILTEIDVESVFKEFDLEYFESKRCKFLSVCNPTLARKASRIEEAIALMLPCNVVVHEKGDGKVLIAALDALPLTSIKSDQIKRLAVMAQASMRTVFQSL